MDSPISMKYASPLRAARRKRTSRGENALCYEYVPLSFHGKPNVQDYIEITTQQV